MRVSFEIDAAAVVTAAACGFVGLFALHAAYPGLHDYWPKSSSDLAGWVQAVGAIGSIIYAGRLLRRQLRHADSLTRLQWERELDQRRSDAETHDLHMLRAVHGLALHCELGLISTFRKMSGTDPDGRHPRTSIERLEGLERTIDVMLAKVANPAAVLLLLQIANHMAYARAGLRTLPKNFVPSNSHPQTRSAHKRLLEVIQVRQSLTDLERELEEKLGM